MARKNKINQKSRTLQCQTLDELLSLCNKDTPLMNDYHILHLFPRNKSIYRKPILFMILSHIFKYYSHKLPLIQNAILIYSSILKVKRDTKWNWTKSHKSLSLPTISYFSAPWRMFLSKTKTIKKRCKCSKHLFEGKREGCRLVLVTSTICEVWIVLPDTII